MHAPTPFAAYAAALREFIADAMNAPTDSRFNSLALTLFALQYQHNRAYRQFCDRRKLAPDTVRDWRAIPAVPTLAFREMELTSLAPAERSVVFHSSGTTGQQPSRHVHGADSLALYEASLRPWFSRHLHPPSLPEAEFLSLTPPAREAPHSSLVHMLAVLAPGTGRATFAGHIESDGAWSMDLALIRTVLLAAIQARRPVLLLGTAFNFVHLLDHLAGMPLGSPLPPGSRIMETGGYKGRSRALPRAELHGLIQQCLGLPAERIVCEYGMCELSSQAYDMVAGAGGERLFRFPPWARVRILSPETGADVPAGEPGLVCIHDLANAWSVAAIQTADLGVARDDGFELLGRAAQAEPRGCSLMPKEEP